MARIKIKNSQVKDKAPVPGDLVAGELAINTHADSPAIYLKDTAGAVRKIAGAGAIGGTPATETAAGIVELATAAETTAGTDATRAVHPAGLKVELDKKANLASPALTGTPTAPTAAAGTNTTQVATTAFVTDAVAKENLWDRTGTVVSPANAGDQVHTATGKLTVGGTAAAPNLEVKADGGIVANTNGLVYDAATRRINIHSSALNALTVNSTNVAGGVYVESPNPSIYFRKGDGTKLGYIQGDGSDDSLSVKAYEELHLGSGISRDVVFKAHLTELARLKGAGQFLLGSNPATPAVSLDPGTTGRPFIRDSQGNVGIGSAPSATSACSFDINGQTGHAQLYLRASSATSATAQYALNPTDSSLDIVSSDFPVRVSVAGSERLRVTAAGVIQAGNNGAGGYAISLDPGTTGSPLVRDSTGRVLVGTSTASTNAKLQIEGAARLQNFANKAALDTAMPAPVAGCLATVNSKLYFHDGTAWKEVTLGAALT